MKLSFDAYVTATEFASDGCAFALGDGRVVFIGKSGGQTEVQAHDGAVLCAAVHPSGEGLVTGGDDGRVVWSKADGTGVEIAAIKGRWIDCLATSTASGLIAFGAGKDVHVRDSGDPSFERTFTHEKSVAGIAFEPKGRKLATATYGGAAIWYARIADQKPQFLKWAGSHVLVAYSPDGRFLMSSMQESQLHGWRLSDNKDLRMGGYPAKIKSLSFMAKGNVMATSGAQGAVVWPFAGSNGPMGKEAAEVGFDAAGMVVRVAGTPGDTILAGGRDDGRVWILNLAAGTTHPVKAEKGAEITALAISADGAQVAWGDEDGNADLVDIGYFS
jgi:WD40 repeat protein